MRLCGIGGGGGNRTRVREHSSHWRYMLIPFHFRCRSLQNGQNPANEGLAVPKHRFSPAGSRDIPTDQPASYDSDSRPADMTVTEFSG